MKKQMTIAALVLLMAGSTAMAQGPQAGNKHAHHNHDGKYSKERMEQWQAERFARMDTDGDGRLTIDELHEGLQRERAERLHKRLDKDGDGFVSPEEFADMHNKRFMRKGGQRNLEKGDIEKRRHMQHKPFRGPSATQ